jgi:hypothetical protein
MPLGAIKVVPPTPCLCQVAVPDVDLRLVDAHVNPVFLIFKILRSVGFCFLKYKNRTVEGWSCQALRIA